MGQTEPSRPTERRARFAALLEGWPQPVELPRANMLAAASADDLLDELTRQRAHVWATCPNHDADELLLRFAATAMTLGGALYSAVQVRHSHSPLSAACLDELGRINQAEPGTGANLSTNAGVYSSLLAVRNVATHATLPTLMREPRLRDADFALPSLVLGLGLGGEAHVYEALGSHAASVVLGAPPALRGFWSAPQLSSAWLPDTAEHATALQSVLRILNAAAPESWPRVLTGASAHVATLRAWIVSLNEAQSNPWHAMRNLLRRKAPYACGFHQRVRLGNAADKRTLDDWFRHTPFDADGFAMALAASPWIVAGAPDQSPLLTQSLAFGGTMFGVFTTAEIAVLREWITGLKEHAAPPPETVGEVRTEPMLTVTAPSVSLQPARHPNGLRQLYHQLVNLDPSVDTHETSLEHLTALLGRAERRARREVSRLGLWPWRPSKGSEPSPLGSWALTHVSTQAAQATKPSFLPQLLSKPDVVWLLAQLAPTAFVDGAWLAGMTSVSAQHLGPARALLTIYRDELGAGDVYRHHGNLMRRTLNDHGVTLPTCDSSEFRDSPVLETSAFSLACLWLAVSRHTGTHLPELLGINLATEIAGLGVDYFRAAQLLRHHGIDPYFFTLHNSIDNADVGHTALSVAAIDDYLLDLRDRAGDEVAQAAWQRVWNGYTSYAIATRPFLLRVASKLGPGLVKRWLFERAQVFTPAALRKS